MRRRRKMMELHTLQAEARTATGKGVARKARAAGRIPAVVYGGGGESAPLTLDPKDLRKLKTARLGWNTPLTIIVEGGADVATAMLADVQRHPVSGKLLHADFLRVAMDATVRVRVPVKVEGRAAGITLGGRISLSLPEVDLVCGIESIPSVVVVDVTPLDINDKVLLQDLVVPEGTKVASRHNPPVVACVGKRGARAEESAEAEEESEEAEE